MGWSEVSGGIERRPVDPPVGDGPAGGGVEDGAVGDTLVGWLDRHPVTWSENDRLYWNMSASASFQSIQNKIMFNEKKWKTF